jgi:hypothetical protein
VTSSHWLAVPTRCGSVQPAASIGAGVGVGTSDDTGVGVGTGDDTGVGVGDVLGLGSAGAVSAGIDSDEPTGRGAVEAFPVGLAVAAALSAACVAGAWLEPHAVRMSADATMAVVRECRLVAMRSIWSPLPAELGGDTLAGCSGS